MIRNADSLRRSWGGDQEKLPINSSTDGEGCQSVEKSPTKRIRQSPFPFKESMRVVEPSSEPIVAPEVISPKEELVVIVVPTKELKLSLTAAKQDDVKWVRNQGYKIWNRLAKWGQEKGELNPKYCLLAKNISKSVINETEISDYQATKGKQMLEKAIQQGFV